MTTLRERQLNALKQMLNLNQPLTKAVANEPIWKVLIFDRVGQDIISPLISIKELRELGVTLHVQLHSDRDSIPEVPAVYFCSPTEENLGRICQDLDNGIYDQYHLNFMSPITRQKLEDLAASAIQSNSVMSIHKVFDQYLNFICLEDDLFIMKHQQSDSLSYYAINKGDTKDTEMEAIMDEIVESLFSVFVTLGNVPIIRCTKGNAAEMVAKKLDKKLRENLWDARNNLFHGQAGTFSFTRPMLILLDRNIDMTTPLHHTWTYQALAHDVLDLSLNRAVVPESSGPAIPGQKVKSRTCDLDSKDPLWSEHKGSPFPTVAEAIQEDLDKYRSSEAEVKKLKSSMGLDADSDLALSMVSDNTQRLTSAVNSLPQLMEKKRLIDMHTTIATAILNSIKSRRLDSFFELEEKIMSKSSGVESKAVMDLITDASAGTEEDKMRLFVIYYLCTSQIPEEEYKKFETALLAANCDIKPMTYMKRWKGFTKMSSQGQYEGGGTKTVSMFSKLVSQGSSFVMEGVKNLVVKKHKLPVSRSVEAALCAGAEGALAWLDPRAARSDAARRAPRHPPPSDAVVFLLGGGSYIEYHNLIDFAKVSRSVEAALCAGAEGALAWLDPRAARSDAARRAPRHPPPSDAVVFLLGGGSYIEYHNLIDFAKVSRSVEAALCAGAEGALAWLDPRAARSDAARRAPRHPPPSDAVVFLLGGGSYIEYHNLIDFAKVSRSVEAALCAGAEGALAWLDPRAARSDAARRAPRHPPPSDAVVFLLGGGSYIEYHNLIDFAKVSRSVEAALCAGAEGALAWLDPRAARSDAARRAPRHPPPSDAVVFLLGGGSYIEYHNLIDFAKVSRSVEAALCAGAEGALAWLDPRAARSDAARRAPRHPPPSDAVVFLLGGGSYIEYHNLIDFAKQQAVGGTSRKIIYGATTLPNASQFLKQLSLLGEELQ